MLLVVLVVLFLVLPVAELYVILQVTHGIGVLETIGVLLLVSAVGGWLCKREGIGVLRRIQGGLDARQLPTRELADGGLILLAGALLVTPGFLSDVLGILLLPPTRAVFRTLLLAALARRAHISVVGGFPGGGFGGGARRGREPGAIDTTGTDAP